MSKINKFTEFKGKFQKDWNKAINWQREKTEAINRYIQGKQKYIIIGTITGVIIVGASFGILQYQNNSINLYHVYVDGELVGTVNDKAIVEKWQSQELLKAHNAYGSAVSLESSVITYEEEVKFKGNFDNQDTLKALDDKMQIHAKGVELVVDGNVIGIVKDSATANRIIESIKASYTPKVDKDGSVAASSSSQTDRKVQLENIRIKQSIRTTETKVNPDKIIDEESMVNLLKKGTLEEKKYIVQEGDTISDIAVKFDLSTKEVYQLNPGLEGELIHIGDELNVTSLEPILTVETQEKVTQNERIPFKLTYKYDDTMFTNESKVIQKGVDGKKRVEYSITKENGVTIEKEILSETIINEPVEKVILKGTKPVPSRGSGTMTWPTVGGVITSYYGSRWGSFHSAIDISGVSDRTIKAADNGKVIQAGWNGGYGYSVTIDHGNGITTLYGHLSSMTVSVGDSVAKGQKIGVMGNTGRSTGTHLHFEVRVNGVAKNPLNYVGN